jgi:hypothetical protein
MPSVATQRRPKPRHVQTVCDICGLDWKRHGRAPTVEKCIELLKADLAAEQRRATPLPPYAPLPYPVPYPVPRPFPPWQPQPWRPQPWYTTGGTTNQTTSELPVISGQGRFLSH